MNTASFFAHYDAIPMPIVILDRKGEIVHSNEQAISHFSTDERTETHHFIEEELSIERNQLLEYLHQVFTLESGDFIEWPLTLSDEKIRLSHIDSQHVAFMVIKLEANSTHDPLPEEIIEEDTIFEELQQRYHSLINENPDGIIYLDENLTILNTNNALERMLGYSTQELKLNRHELITEETLAIIQQQFHLALAGNHQTYEIDAFNKIGDKLNLQIKTIPVKIHNRFKGAYKIIKDITAYKKAQLDTIEQAAQLRSLIDSIPEFIIFKDENNRIIEMNDYAKYIFGVNEGEYKGKTCVELNCGNLDAQQLIMNNVTTDQVAWEHKSKIDYEYQLDQANGETATYEIIKAPTFLPDGNRKYLIAIGRDISKRKKVEKELIETQELIESIFTNNADAISVSDLEKKIIKVNPAFQRLYGYNEDNMIEHLIDVYPDDNKDEASRIIDSVIKGEGVVDFETVRKRKDGSLIDVSITYSPIKDHEGNITAMSAITRDIRDRKKTDELLLRSEKLSAIGQLAAAVAHEVRNPLTSVKGFIQLYKDRIDEEILHLMLSEMDRIESIVNEFLSLARPQAVTYQELDMMALIRNIASLMEPESVLNNVDVYTDFHTPSLNMLVEKNQMTQVLMNIIKNGIESMPEGGPLSITTCHSDTHLFIEIADKGVGIPEERLQHLGEPFFSNKDMGTGLGLVVSYKIIHEHKGTIHFDSSVGNGTVVTISLPL
ncbi:MAG: PAS domain S-box protein [Anaerobacillus sp.]